MTKATVTVLEGGPITFRKELAAIWQYRHFYTFLFHEISMKRYKRTLLGAWWLVIRPLIPAIFSVVVFTSVVPMDTNGTPYPVFFFSSYASWVLFQATLILMPRAILWLRSLMRRTYFPKLLIPLASIGPPLLEWLVSMTCFALVVLFYRATLGSWPIDLGWVAMLPVATLMALLFAIAIGIVLSVVAVFVKDVVYTAPYFVQILMLLTPILYPIHFISEGFRWVVYVLNPMASIVEMTRWSLTGVGEPPWFYFCVSSTIILVSLIMAIWFFVRAEPYISDES